VGRVDVERESGVMQDPTVRFAAIVPEWLRGVEVVILEGDDALAQWDLAVRLNDAKEPK
jgi:hypothetical protein